MYTMRSGSTLMYVYHKETLDKIELARHYSVDYSAAGIEFHPISKAFTEAKREGQEEVKNYIPYMWN